MRRSWFSRRRVSCGEQGQRRCIRYGRTAGTIIAFFRLMLVVTLLLFLYISFPPSALQIGKCEPGESLEACFKRSNEVNVDTPERCQAGQPTGVEIACNYQVQWFHPTTPVCKLCIMYKRPPSYPSFPTPLPVPEVCNFQRTIPRDLPSVLGQCYLLLPGM